MFTTRLQLELLFQEPVLDLSAVSEVILSDVGATLQILRLIGEEYPVEEDRPTRIEDCIASLNIEDCYAAVCSVSVPHDAAMLAEWRRCRSIAKHARELARCIDGLSPEEAYLVGLLHGVGRLPHILGWNSAITTVDEHLALGVMLADYWHLPAYLLAAIRDEQECVTGSHWGDVLRMARCEAECALPSSSDPAFDELALRIATHD